jgi:SpoIVB peptidase S55
MLLRRLALGSLLASLALIRVPAQTTQMGIDEIRPGMVGVGRTVFDGTRVEEFKANILGVLENVIGTHRNLILAKLEGGPLATTGVIAGMSGSPVYIDGKLIGAVSYSLGQFSKEPIAGITPIAEMTDATAFSNARPPAAKVHVDFPLTRENLSLAFRRALNWNRPFAERPGDAEWLGPSAIAGVAGPELGMRLQPIATPLMMSGFEPDLADMLAGAFREQGFVPTGRGVAAGRAGEKPYEGPLKPGDAVGVALVRGDLELGATGTVTHVEGDRVYAFGHPLYNLGPTAFPMTRAYVYTVLPSLAASMKLSTTGEVIGSFLQDRAVAIAGRLGPGPKMIPVTMTLESTRAPKRTFTFELANDQMFTPLMAAAAMTSTLASYERQYGTATFYLRGTAKVNKHETIAFDNVFAGDQPSVNAATYVAAPIAALLGNDFEKVDIDSVELSISSTEETRTATLERVWIDDPRPRAGRTVPLKALLRTYRGEEIIQTIPVEIPSNLTGPVSVLVADGSRLAQIEQRETRTAQPRSVDQIIRMLNRSRRGNTLYVKLLGSDPGAVVKGEALTSLPPSVLGVLEADRSGGSFSSLSNATLGEWRVPTDRAISGSRVLSITVSPD